MMVTMTLTEFNQRRSAAIRMADVEDVLILRDGVPAYRLTGISTRPRTLASEVEAGRAAPPPPGAAPARERRVWDVPLDLVEASIAEREALR
jgi:antitoxin (DNA-binding transcriptional repressor) of toxin-antitoxin stability system